MVEDPLAKLAKKMEKNECKFELKTIKQKQLKKMMKKIKKKKSTGTDGLNQEKLIMGANIIIAPLTAIINQSTTDGEFPKDWKEALVTPVLKKGSPEEVSNYRPVSCLPAASKLLELVVCDQMTDYLKGNKLLPANQHGFRIFA